ncbi:Homeobox protein KNOX3 [Hordeum vulgare]|nr:Homeobox protein KNOX3 [Hordeum vulgare]
MAERFPDDGAAANGFGRRHLHEDEACLLYEADYLAPPDMRVSGLWRLSADGVSVSPPPSGVDRWTEIACIRSSVSESSHNLPRYVPDSNTLWTTYFERRHADELATTNGVEPRGRHNSEGRRQWSLTPRRMETAWSSSSGSRSSWSLASLPVKPEPQEIPLGRRTRNGDIVINEPGASSHLVKSKTESGLVPVKQEHLAMATAAETALKWVWDDYVREEMER